MQDTMKEYNQTATNSQSCFSNLYTYGGPLKAYSGAFRRKITVPTPVSPMPLIFMLGKPHGINNVPNLDEEVIREKKEQLIRANYKNMDKLRCNPEGTDDTLATSAMLYRGFNPTLNTGFNDIAHLSKSYYDN